MNANNVARSKYGLCLLIALCAALMLSACENDNDDFDHDIPEGKGTIVVNNNTENDIEVYIAGIRYQDTHNDDYEFYDRDPGVYRMVLDEDNGDRNWFGEVDVLEGKKVILDVFKSSYEYNYDVYLRID